MELSGAVIMILISLGVILVALEVSYGLGWLRQEYAPAKRVCSPDCGDSWHAGFCDPDCPNAPEAKLG